MRISDWSSDVCSSDLGWVVIGTASDREWLSLLAVMEREDLKSDPDFMDLSWRLHNNAAVTEVVSGWSRALPTAEAVARLRAGGVARSEEHTSELQSLLRHSYAVFCLKKTKNTT